MAQVSQPTYRKPQAAGPRKEFCFMEAMMTEKKGEYHTSQDEINDAMEMLG